MTVESTESVEGDNGDLAERGEEGIDFKAERALRDRAFGDCGGGVVYVSGWCVRKWMVCT